MKQKQQQQPDPTESPTPPTNEALFASAFNLFAPSMAVIRRNMISILLFVVVPVALTSAGSFAAQLRHDSDPLAAVRGLFALCAALGYLLTLLTMPALTLVQLHGARKQDIAPDDALSQGLRLVPRMIGLLICMGVIFVVAFLLLIVPFFFMLRRYILAPYYLVDQNLGIFDALKASAADSKRYSLPLWGLIGVEMLVAALSIIPGIGRLASVVASLLYGAAPAVRYEQIKAAKAGNQPLAPIEEATP